jgi:anti-sigma B factor antagonist
MNDRPLFRVETDRPCPGRVVVAVSGEIDLHTSGRLRDEFDGLDVTSVERLVVDLSDVGFIDSTGLGVLVAAARRLPVGAPLVLVCHTERVREVLLMTGLDRIFPIYDTRDEAVDASSA